MGLGLRVRAAPGWVLAACAWLGAGGPASPRPAWSEDPPPAVPALSAAGALDFHPLPSFASRIQTALPGKRADQAKRQRAIDAALEWLAAHQAPDGGWRPHELTWCNGVKGDAFVDGPGKEMYEVGVSGIAVAAFLMVGIGPFAEHPHAETVRKALDYLRRVQDPEGCFGPRRTQHYIYNHAFACLAVLEAYGMTGDRALGESARKGLSFGILSQNPGFGWRYGVRPGDNDTSVTIAMGACLSVAHAINEGVAAADGLEPLPYPEAAVQGMHAWFDRMTDASTGIVGYITRGAGPARTQEMVDKFPGELVEPMTAGAILLRRILPPPGPPRPELEAKSVALLRALLPDWSPQRGSIDFLYWYYGTLALSVVGGPDWEAWDAALGTALVGSQRLDGALCDVRGSWDAADAWSTEGGRVYTTGFGVLCLAGANRYRPLPRADLLAALKAKTVAPHLQALAARAAAALGLEVEEAAVLALAKSPSAEVRAASAALLARGPVREASLQALVALLGDPSPAVAVAALRAVEAADGWRERVVETLAGMLGDMRMDLTLRALGALRRAGPAAAPVADRIAPLLTHPDVRVRGEALRCLWRFGGDRTALRAPLAQALREGTPEERARTLSVLEAAEVASEGLTDAVRAGLASDASPVAVEAARLLRDGPTDAAAALAAVVKALSAPALETRLVALRLLASWAPGAALPFDAVAPLAVAGPRPLRLEAVRMLARAAPLTPLACAALFAASAHPHAPLAEAAKAALAQAALPPDERARLLTAALRLHTAPALRQGALHGLQGLGADAVPHVRALFVTGGLPDESQAELLRLLGRLGPAAKPLLPDVLRALETGSTAVVRRAAADALGEPGISDPGAVVPVVRAITDRDIDVSLACVRALVRLARREDGAAKEVDRLLRFQGKEPPRSALTLLDELPLWPDAVARVDKTLLDLLGHENSTVAWQAVDALAALGGAAVKLLLPVIDPKTGRSSDPRAHMVARTFEKIGRPAEAAVPALLSLLTQRQYESAADALGAIGKPAVAGLSRALSDTNPRVRVLAARGLGRAGPEAASALGALRRAAKDSDPDVRQEAEAALRKVK